jgi:hypothetical protein
VKYSLREDRDIRNTIKRAKPYESKRSIRSRYDVNRVVDRFSSGLGSYGEEAKSKAPAYKPKFSAETSSDSQLLDKYYISSHHPPRDILTELGDTSGNKSWVPLMVLGIIIFFLFRS